MGAESDGGQGSLTPVGRSHRVSSKLSHNQFKLNRLVIINNSLGTQTKIEMHKVLDIVIRF